MTLEFLVNLALLPLLEKLIIRGTGAAEDLVLLLQERPVALKEIEVGQRFFKNLEETEELKELCEMSGIRFNVR